MTQHSDIFGTTTNPCPPWCEMAAGHGYDSNDFEAAYRFHELEVGEIKEPIRDGGHLHVHVGIIGSETLRLDADGARVLISPACIMLDVPCGQMTSSQATEAARMLLSASKRLDAITMEQQS